MSSTTSTSTPGWKPCGVLSRVTRGTLFFEAPIEADIIAQEAKCFSTEDYLGYLRGFTDFASIEVLGASDFSRPIIRCTH